MSCIRKTVGESVDKPVRTRRIGERNPPHAWFADAMAKKRAANRELQHQRHQLAAARADALARGIRARHRRPAGAEMHRRGLPARGDRGARLFGDLARAAELERSRDPEPRRRAGRDAARPARRSRPEPEPLHRGGGVRHPDRQHVCAQRQSVAGAEVRLQARLAGPAARPCAGRCSTAACRRC